MLSIKVINKTLEIRSKNIIKEIEYLISSIWCFVHVYLQQNEIIKYIIRSQDVDSRSISK